MKVEIWSDYVCPFCYIGKRKLEAALGKFAHAQEVKLSYRSFQLDPNAPRDTKMNVHEMLAAKYGMSVEQAKAMNAQVVNQAKEVGLDYHLDTIILTNTYDAHRLAYFANETGKMGEMAERLLRAYFVDSLHLGDHETLAKLAEEVGLDKAAVQEMLAGDEYSAQISKDKTEGARLGISGVPFFVFNDKYAVSGAQPSEVFAQVLQKVWEEEQSTPVLQVVDTTGNGSAQNDGCADGSCKI